jgi:hypothetical protein
MGHWRLDRALRAEAAIIGLSSIADTFVAHPDGIKTLNSYEAAIRKSLKLLVEMFEACQAHRCEQVKANAEALQPSTARSTATTSLELVGAKPVANESAATPKPSSTQEIRIPKTKPISIAS